MAIGIYLCQLDILIGPHRPNDLVYQSRLGALTRHLKQYDIARFQRILKGGLLIARPYFRPL